VMLLQRSLIPNEGAFVASLFHHADHADHCTYYQVDLHICVSGGMLLFMGLHCQQQVAKSCLHCCSHALESALSGGNFPRGSI
jgi:hypothetical protein